MSEFTLVSDTRDETVFPALTMAVALLIAIVCLALFLRLFELGVAPLNSAEARQALAAYNFSQGTGSLFTGSPLLFTASAILFTLFTPSDFTARLAPVLGGTMLVLLPMLFRRDLGRTGALISSALLAFSPSLVFFSRTLDGVIPAVAASLAVVAFSARFLDTHAARDLYITAACAALALLSAPDVWTIALALALLFIASKFGLVKTPEPSAISYRRSALLVFLLVLLAISTTFLLHREGLGAAFDLLSAWLDSLRFGASLFDLLRLLAVYEPLVTLFGIAFVIELVFGSREKYSRGVMVALALWAVTALLLISLSADNNPARVVVIVVPLALMAGASIGAWVERMIDETRGLGVRELLWHEMPILGVSVGLVSFLSIVVAELAQRGNIVTADALTRLFGSSQDNPALGNSIVMLMFLFAFIAATVLAVTTLGMTRARNVGALFALVILSLWTIRQTAMLNFSDNGAYSPREWIAARTASPNVRDLVRDLESQSRWRANDTHSLVIAADSSLGPIVQWNLRDFRYARFSFRPTVTPGTQALVTAVDAPAPVGSWIAQKYQIETTRGIGAASSLRALIYRDVGNLESTDAILWVPRP